jgi:hypothetical protein
MLLPESRLAEEDKSIDASWQSVTAFARIEAPIQYQVARKVVHPHYEKMNAERCA